MDDSSRSSSDSVDVSTMESSPPLLNGHIDMEQFSDDDNGLPSLEIIEQPQQRGFRFRYECEGPSHGGLQGSRSEKIRKTVPTVKIRNYSGPARVVVTLVTDETVPKAHAHKLVGKNCADGVCIMDMKAGNSQISFPNLCIQHVTRKKAADVLEQRICSAMQNEKKRIRKNWNLQINLAAIGRHITFITFLDEKKVDLWRGIYDEDKKRANEEACSQAKKMQLNVVRLCFECYLTNNDGNIVTQLNSLVSEPIYDSKAPGANALKICRMDKYSGCCTGNDEVFLLCEKVQKDDIMVRFLEQDEDGNTVWEAYGQFGPFDVHRQFAIVFKTPEYRDVNILNPVNVLVMLQRKSDRESSDPKSFTYYPRIKDKEDIDRKRRKLIPSYHHGGSGFGSMNPTLGGVNSNDGSNGDGNGGMQNGGSIPDFNNLPLTSAFGQRPLNLGSRQVLHAKRTLPSFHQAIAPALYTEAPANIIANSTEFVYEEVSNLSPPMAQLQGVCSPQYFTGGAVSPNGSTLSANSPYSNGAMMVDSPMNIGQTSISQLSPGALSPHQQMHPTSSPINLGIQQIIIGSQSIPVACVQQTIAGPQSIQVTEPVVPSSQNTQIQSNLQLTMGDLKLEHVTEPVQVSSLSSDSLEADFMWTNPQLNAELFDQSNLTANQYVNYQESGMKAMDAQLGGFAQHYGSQSCAWQARGTGGYTDLQDVIDVLGCIPSDGYDEVDSARTDKFDTNDLVARSAGSASTLLKQTAKLEPGIMTKAVTLSELQKTQPTPFTADIAEDIIARQPLVSQSSDDDREPTVARKAVITTETSVQAESVHKTDTAVQTEMDPMLNLAMKTSQALQYYASSGDIRSLLMVQRFLMAVQDQDGDLPLHTALINQRYEVFQNILDVMVTLPDAYTRINAYNFHHQTPLHLAVITNQSHAVDLLIRAGADTTLVDRNGYTPAHLAVLYGRNDCLTNLLKYLRPGVSAKEPFPELNIRCYDGFTPAHLAGQLENLAAMKLLVYGKADVNLADGKSGRTPLHHAVEIDDLSLAAYLILQAGSSVNVKRFDGNTALHIACGRGNVGMVALLMAGGADPNIENDDIVELSDSANSEESDSQESSEEEVVNNDNVNSNVNVDKNDDDGDDKDADTEKDQKKKKSKEQDVVDGQNVETEKMSKRSLGKGLIPADFADSNEKILRVLHGEPYSSITDSGTVHQVTDKMASLRFVSKDSGQGSMGTCSTGSGDMNRVEYLVRMSLSYKLDPARFGSDWQALTHKLGMNSLGQLGGHSPTRVLLNLYEEEGGTVARLIQALTDIRRDDCVSLLRASMDQSVRSREEKGQKDVNKDPKYDSGVSDSYMKSASPEHRGNIVT